MKEKINISAVLDKDLKKILDKYNLSTKIDEGQIHCESCQEIITWDNISALKVKNGKLILFCDNVECIENIEKI